ncbi:MAG: hypothetical protein M3R17_08580, partial [Bacteroidota bacterium]|nr:hypothetical protein [Bacteroidota bacterium]
MGHYDFLFAQQKSKSSRYPDAYDDAYESAYIDNGLLTVEQMIFLESFNISEQEVTTGLGEEGKIHFAVQLGILMQQVNAGEGDTIEDETGMTTVYSVSDENGNLCLIITGNAAYMHYQYLDDVAQVQPTETIAPQPENKVVVPPPPYEKKPGDYVFESMILSGDDQLSYTVNRGKNQYGYILGIGSDGAYTRKLKRALHMAIKVDNLFGQNITDPFTAEQLTDPKFDNHTLEEFAKYQALKNLKDQSGNIGPETLKALDHDARMYEVMNKSGQQDPTEKDRLSGNAVNNKNVYQYGQVGNYTFNMYTSAGREMFAAAQNAIKYGKEYTPSKEKLNEQYIQAVGSDQLLKDSDNALRKANMVLLRINISLANPDLDAEIKVMLTEKKQILSAAVQNMTTLLNSDDREVSDAKEEQLENAKQKEAEASKAFILPPPPVSPGGEVVKQAARTAAAEAGGTAAAETGGVLVSAGAVTAVAVCAVAIVAVACLYRMLTAGGLVKLKGLIDELTKTVDDVLMFVDSPAILPKAPVAKPIDKPENKPEEKP